MARLFITTWVLTLHSPAWSGWGRPVNVPAWLVMWGIHENEIWHVLRYSDWLVGYPQMTPQCGTLTACVEALNRFYSVLSLTTCTRFRFEHKNDLKLHVLQFRLNQCTVCQLTHFEPCNWVRPNFKSTKMCPCFTGGSTKQLLQWLQAYLTYLC